MSYNKHITSISSSKYILGDSLIELKKLKDHSVDMVFCDPPYNLQLSKTLYRPDASKVSGVNDAWDKFNNFQDYDIFTKTWFQHFLKKSTFYKTSQPKTRSKNDRKWII